MDDRLKESLSALLDGEVDELELQRLLTQIEPDQLRATWARYHRVRNLVGTGTSALHSLDVSLAVARAIGNDALVAHPSVATSAPQRSGPVRLLRLPDTVQVWRKGAIAASIVLAFVLGLSLQQASRETPRTPESPVLETVVAASVPSTASPLSVAPSVRVEPAPIPVLAVAQSGSDPTVISPVELAARKQIDALLAKDSLRQPKFNDSLSEVHARRFNAYLLRHSEQASLSSRYGGVPLARVAALNAVGTE